VPAARRVVEGLARERVARFAVVRFGVARASPLVARRRRVAAAFLAAALRVELAARRGVAVVVFFAVRRRAGVARAPRALPRSSGPSATRVTRRCGLVALLIGCPLGIVPSRLGRAGAPA
jgi:hypothetical protein